MGVKDSVDKGREYLEATVGDDIGIERRDAYLRDGVAMVDELHERTRLRSPRARACAPKRTRSCPGLYAADNCSAGVMGSTYPGPGATIGADGAVELGHGGDVIDLAAAASAATRW